jgi:hypothetical protein
MRTARDRNPFVLRDKLNALRRKARRGRTPDELSTRREAPRTTKDAQMTQQPVV